MPDACDNLPKTPPRPGQAPIARQPADPRRQADQNKRKVATGLLPKLNMSTYTIPDALLNKVFGRSKEAARDGLPGS